MCTQKAQQDLRHEENIDAFSMSGDTGRISPIAITGDDNGGGGGGGMFFKLS